MDNQFNSFSERLLYAMKIHNMKQANLVKATGLTKSMICKYLNGTVEPSAKSIYLISKVLGVSSGWLLGYEESRFVSLKAEEDITPALELYKYFSKADDTTQIGIKMLLGMLDPKYYL